MFSTVFKLVSVSSLALALTFVIGTSQANGQCRIIDSQNKWEAHESAITYGPFEVVWFRTDLMGGNVFYTATEVFQGNYHGALEFTCGGDQHYYGSGSSSHLVSDWAHNCNAIYLTW